MTTRARTPQSMPRVTLSRIPRADAGRPWLNRAAIQLAVEPDTVSATKPSCRESEVLTTGAKTNRTSPATTNSPPASRPDGQLLAVFFIKWLCRAAPKATGPLSRDTGNAGHYTPDRTAPDQSARAGPGGTVHAWPEPSATRRNGTGGRGHRRGVPAPAVPGQHHLVAGPAAGIEIGGRVPTAQLTHGPRREVSRGLRQRARPQCRDAIPHMRVPVPSLVKFVAR